MLVAKTTIKEQSVLLEFIMTSFKASFGITQGLLFFDNGATLAIIHDKFAELLQLKGEKVTEWIKVLGQAWERWHTTLYNVPMVDNDGVVHTVKAYGMEEITDTVEYIEVKGVSHLFPEVRYQDIKRPIGIVDMLIGLNYAYLHPTNLRSDGNLRLMSSKFGTASASMDHMRPLLAQGSHSTPE